MNHYEPTVVESPVTVAAVIDSHTLDTETMASRMLRTRVSSITSSKSVKSSGLAGVGPLIMDSGIEHGTTADGDGMEMIGMSGHSLTVGMKSGATYISPNVQTVSVKL